MIDRDEVMGAFSEGISNGAARRGLSLVELSEKAGVPLRLLEDPDPVRIRFDDLVRIADVLGVPVTRLLAR